jgi:tripartite-type tricarboxylate transporter receptor subunit TctC
MRHSPAPLAVTTATRWEGLPDIPTVGEFVPGYEASTWWGLGAPKNTPVEIINKLNRETGSASLNRPAQPVCSTRGCKGSTNVCQEGT